MWLWACSTHDPRNQLHVIFCQLMSYMCVKRLSFCWELLLAQHFFFNGTRNIMGVHSYCELTLPPLFLWHNILTRRLIASHLDTFGVNAAYCLIGCPSLLVLILSIIHTFYFLMLPAMAGQTNFISGDQLQTSTRAGTHSCTGSRSERLRSGDQTVCCCGLVDEAQTTGIVPVGWKPKLREIPRYLKSSLLSQLMLTTKSSSNDIRNLGSDIDASIMLVIFESLDLPSSLAHMSFVCQWDSLSFQWELFVNSFFQCRGYTLMPMPSSQFCEQCHNSIYIRVCQNLLGTW